MLAGAVVHALWNMLVRRGGHPEAFMWWMSAAAALAYAPLGYWLLSQYGVSAEGVPWVVGTVLLHALYFILLGRAYRFGDLSMVYPIARGTGPLLVPVLAVLFLGEQLSLLGVVGVILIVAGVVTLPMGGLTLAAFGRLAEARHDPAARYALLTGVTIAAYSALDKAGVARVQPVLYGYFIFPGSALIAAPYFWGPLRASTLACWRENSRSIALAGALTPLSYLMALTAFSLGQVSYLAALREVSIVVAALLGALVLRERLTRARWLSACVTALGVALVGLGG